MECAKRGDGDRSSGTRASSTGGSPFHRHPLRAGEGTGSNMYTYIARRLIYAVLTFAGITIATFALIHSVPGDPVAFYAGRFNASPAVVAALRREHRLDQPLIAQYLHWAGRVSTLEFG